MGEAGCALDAMKLTLEQRLAHSGHPVLLWMMDNIYIRTDPAGNVKADKEKSTEKIDGAVATIIGLDRAIRCGNNTGACPSLSVSSIEGSLRKLVASGELKREGSGKNTCYFRIK